MTDQEKRQQKGEVMVEFEETQDDCLSLQVRLRRMGERFVEFGEGLSRYSGEEELTMPDYRSDLDVEAAASVAGDFRAKLQRLSELESRAELIRAPVHRNLNLRTVRVNRG